jgi:hypothetical protein
MKEGPVHKEASGNCRRESVWLQDGRICDEEKRWKMNEGTELLKDDSRANSITRHNC